MADITRRVFLRHLRGAPTSWVRHYVKGEVKHEGIGQSFWYRPLTAVLSEVPGLRSVDPRFAQFWPHRHGTDAIFLALLSRLPPGASGAAEGAG